VYRSVILAASEFGDGSEDFGAQATVAAIVPFGREIATINANVAGALGPIFCAHDMWVGLPPSGPGFKCCRCAIY
jgi:hypothetical protein